MNAIAAVSLDWGIGKGNDLLFHIGEDMKRFRALTTGGTVIMGRKTLDSMPEGKPLPRRRNIVLTRQKDFAREGVETAASVEEVLSLVAGEDPEKVWVIGGGEIYRQMLPHCRLCYLTRVYARPESDVYFPDLDTLPQWQVLRSGAFVSDGTLEYQFIEYISRQV